MAILVNSSEDSNSTEADQGPIIRSSVAVLVSGSEESNDTEVPVEVQQHREAQQTTEEKREKPLETGKFHEFVK